MQEIIRTVSEHPLAAMGIAFAVLVVLYFLLTKLVKVALILILLAVVVAGYLYYRHPGNRPADLKDAVDQVRSGTRLSVEKGKTAYKKGKELIDQGRETFEKGKEMVDKGKTVLDRGIDKGKEGVEKGKVVADEIGKLLGGERETETK